MAVITGIETLRGRVVVSIDGLEYARVAKAHYEKCPLHEGDDIDPEAWIDRIASAQFADAYEAALTSLDYAARSAKEIASTLRRKGFVEPAVEATVSRLRENGLINDAAFARRLAENQRQKPVGVYALKRKLRSKGISEDDAEAALDTFDDDQQREACLTAARGLWRKYADLPRREGRAKLSQALARRGFGWDAIESAVDALTE